VISTIVIIERGGSMKRMKNWVFLVISLMMLVLPFKVYAIKAPAATAIYMEGVGDNSSFGNIVNNKIWPVYLVTSSADYTTTKITVTPADPSYVVEGDGVIQLTLDQVTTAIVKVTDPADGTFETYTFNISLALESSGSNPSTGAFLNVGLIGGASVCCVAIYVFQKKRNHFYKI